MDLSRICNSNHYQKLSSFITFWWIHATHIDLVLKRRSHNSLIVQVRFHISRFFSPSPPSVLGVVTVSQETFAEYLPSRDPFQRRGSQLSMESFFVHRGRPKYRMGREPCGMPDIDATVEIASSVRPQAKKHDFSGLEDRPESCRNSSRTERMPWMELGEPSQKIRRSSAKHKISLGRSGFNLATSSFEMSL